MLITNYTIVSLAVGLAIIPLPVTPVAYGKRLQSRTAKAYPRVKKRYIYTCGCFERKPSISEFQKNLLFQWRMEKCAPL